MISRCCKDKISVYSCDEGTSFYVCYRCDMPTDPIAISPSGSDEHDTGITPKVKRVAHFS